MVLRSQFTLVDQTQFDYAHYYAAGPPPLSLGIH